MRKDKYKLNCGDDFRSLAEIKQPGRISEIKKMEELLRESEYKFRSFFDLSPHAIILTELETGKIIDVNNKFCELTGYDKREILGRTSIEVGFFSREDRNTFLKELKSKGYAYGLERDFKSKDGSVLTSLMFSKIIQTRSDNFILNIFVDITDRKRIEEERDRILNLSYDLICILGADGYFKYVNPAWERILGYSREELLSMPFLDIVHPDERQKNSEDFFALLASGNQKIDHVNLLIHKNGSIRKISWAATPLPEKGLVYCIGRDFTEKLKYRQHLEEMVKERTAELEKTNKETQLYHKRIEALINSSKDFILFKDKDFKYLIANKAHEELLNMKVSDIIGKTDFDFMPKELAEECRKSDENALICKDPVESEETLNDRVFHEIKQRVTDEKGEIIGIAAIIRDITARKQTERELIEAKERFQTLSGSLLKMMEDQRRHIARELHDEIGQQLTALKIKLENAQQLSNSKEYLNSLNETMAIVENLLRLVRNLSLELRPSVLDDLGLVPAIRWYVKRLEQETGGLIDFVADSMYNRFSPDIENACFRVAQEALTNAIKHSKAQRIGIELRQVENNLQLTILDNGIGFDAEFALEEAKMGKSFGLLGMHERIFLTGGTIKIESTYGKGTRIQAYFPLSEDLC